MQTTVTTPVDAILSVRPDVRGLQFPGRLRPVPAIGTLSVQVLRSTADRLLIAPLRQYADFGSEYELDPGIAAFEKTKDAVGIVMAVLQDAVPIATIRFIPGGLGITLTERYWADAAAGTEILGPNNWEVGRLVMAPENRRADLLPQCMSLALLELVEHAQVEQFHGSCLMRMTRLYRRFGMTERARSTSGGGKDCALMHGHVSAIARALKVPLQQELGAAPVLQ